MTENRRKEIRRETDRVLDKLLETLQVVEKISRGEQADFTEAYADLVGLKNQLGRREVDRRIGDALCATIGAIASNIGHPGETKEQPAEERLRRVRLTKVSGGKGHATIAGWEEAPPEVGKSYRVFQENGSVVRTSPITRVSEGFVQTRNSLYQLEILGEQTA
jgi:hypothetical protein